VRSGFTPLHLGVITESVLNRTLSGIEEDGARISQRPKPLLKRLGWPDVVAIEANVLPAERGNVGEQLVRQRLVLGAKLCNGTAEVDGVPKDDCGDHRVWWPGRPRDRRCAEPPPRCRHFRENS
jgi:hypothetical protein